jgi:hypothetical protein
MSKYKELQANLLEIRKCPLNLRKNRENFGKVHGIGTLS